MNQIKHALNWLQLKEQIQGKIYELDEYEADCCELYKSVRHLRESEIMDSYTKEGLRPVQEEIERKTEAARSKRDGLEDVMKMIVKIETKGIKRLAMEEEEDE